MKRVNNQRPTTMPMSRTKHAAPLCKGPGCTLAALLLLLCGEVNAAELRDPTRPGWQAPRRDADQATAAQLELQMLRIDATQRSALINGKLYRVGDRIGSADGAGSGSNATIVQKIEVDHVQLATPAGTRILPLHAGAFSKHAVREMPARPIKDSGK